MARGLRHRPGAARPRPGSRRFRLACIGPSCHERRELAITLALVLALALVALPGCRATDFLDDVGQEHLDIGRMEADIRSGLQRRLEGDARATSESVTSVGRVRCRERSELAATCHARVVRPRGRQRVRIDVTVDPTTGEYTWEVGG